MGCKARVQLTTNMQSVFVYSLFVVMLIWKVNVRPENIQESQCFSSDSTLEDSDYCMQPPMMSRFKYIHQ